MKKRYIWTAISLTFAIFSKEFGMFGPFAAIMTYLMVEYNDNKRISKKEIVPVLVLLIPVILWFGVRKLFVGGLSGNYGYSYMTLPLSLDFGDWKPFIIKTIRTLFHWPIGWPVHEMRFGAGYEISDIVSGKIFFDFKYTHIIAILNPIFGLCFIIDIVQGLRKNKETLYSQLIFYILPWVLGIYALLMLTLDFLGIRYGYTFFMLIIPFSFYIIIESKIKWRRLLYICYIVTLSIMGLISLKTHYTKSDSHIAFYQHSKQLSELIQKAYSADSTRPIYLINDVSGTWGNYYLGIFASRDMNVNFTVLNSVWILEDFLSDESTGDHYVNITKKNDTYTCSIKIPDNRVFFFYGADDSKILKSAVKKNSDLLWKRSEKLEYDFHLIPTKGVAAPYGSKMEIYVKDKDPMFIYFSFEDNSYKMIEY